MTVFFNTKGALRWFLACVLLGSFHNFLLSISKNRKFHPVNKDHFNIYIIFCLLICCFLSSSTVVLNSRGCYENVWLTKIYMLLENKLFKNHSANKLTYYHLKTMQVKPLLIYCHSMYHNSFMTSPISHVSSNSSLRDT